MANEIKKYTITEPWLSTSCALGEGPYWERKTNTLRFVDIINEKLFFVDLAAGPSSLKEVQLDHSIGITANIQGNDDEFVFGGKIGYGIYTRKTGATRWIKKFWTDEERKDDGGGKPGVAGLSREDRMRSNDGAVDPAGRFFVGAMNDPTVVNGNLTDEGVLFRLDSDLSLHRVKENITIPNGMTWTDNSTKMHLTDSPTQVVYRHDYDLSTGEIDLSKADTFFTCPYEGGVPDGHCKDEEGNYWIACFGTSRVIRVDPHGKTLAEVELPTRCVTCPVLCGTELVITTASEEEPEKYPESTKLAGAVFKVDVGVRGMPINEFKLDVKA